MNTKQFSRSLCGALIAFALAALIILPCLLARAESFNATNYLSSATVLAGNWPTNVAGTNGLNTLTGGKISLANVQSASFYFSGYSTTNTNSTVTIKFVLSDRDFPPRAPDGTNLDWTLTSPLTLNVPIVGSGPQYWVTNLNAEVLAGANWIGIWSITNANGTNVGSTCTNVDYGLNKKINKVSLQ